MMGFDEALNVAKMQQDGVRQAAGGLIATFYRRPVQNKLRSEAEGRPCFDSREYVMILIPGDQKSKIDRRVKDEDKQRFSEAWTKFQNNEKGVVIGTPLTEWNYLSSTRTAELKALGLSTVEEIADMADAYLGKLGPDGRKLQGRAKQFLDSSGDLEKELREGIQARDQTISNLSADMEILRRQVDELRGGKVDKRTKAFKESQQE
ncbi:MAG: hypothetical protein ABUJ98_14170 [Hyphomicrobium sp.]